MSQKGQVQNDRVREKQAGGNRGIREGIDSSSGEKQQEASYGKGSQTDSGFRGKLASSAGRQKGVDPSFGERPQDTWVEGNTVNPTEGSVSYDAQQTAIEYNIPSFVVSESAWNANNEKAPAFSVKGQMYVVENAPEKNRGMLAPHEITHIMKQTGFQPYLDFVKRTPDAINMNDRAAQIVLERTAKHRGITLEQLSDALSDPETGFQSNGAAMIFFDELNAMVYGHIASGNGIEIFAPGGVCANVFHDFDAYSRELTVLHERFKAERNQNSPVKNKSKNKLAPKKIEFEDLSPNEIQPVNEITDREQYEYLVRDFQENGYDGRPVVVYETPYGYQALTGSHRVAAAREADIDVPAAVIRDSDVIERLSEAYDDWSRAEEAKLLFEEGMIDETTRDLLAREEELNQENYGVPYAERKRFKLAAPVEESGDLVALHNLTEDKLLGDLRLGGFPMPSIAVTKASIPHTNFGNITLVMDKNSIDPKANKKNTVYSADAWTPTAPRVEYQVNGKAHRRAALWHGQRCRLVCSTASSSQRLL